MTVCLLLLFLLSVLAAVCGHDNPTNVIVVVAAAVAAVAMNVFPLSPGCLVGFPGASLSVGSPWLARQSSVPRWFACKSHAVALSLLLFSLFFLFLLLLLLFFFFFLSSFSSASLWWLPPSAAMTTPQRWMIRPTYTVIVVAVAFVAAAVAAVAMCFSTCAWLPGWVPWCVAVGRVALAASAILGAPMVRLQRSCCCDVCFRCSPPSAAMTTPQRWMIWPTHCVISCCCCCCCCCCCGCCGCSWSTRKRKRSSALPRFSLHCVSLLLIVRYLPLFGQPRGAVRRAAAELQQILRIRLFRLVVCREQHVAMSGMSLMPLHIQRVPVSSAVCHFFPSPRCSSRSRVCL